MQIMSIFVPKTCSGSGWPYKGYLTSFLLETYVKGLDLPVPAIFGISKIWVAEINNWDPVYFEELAQLFYFAS